MKDKNGKEILLGDIVRVTGSCVKSYNGTYYVKNSGSPDCDTIIMIKINKDGEISHSKYRTKFFPLICFVGNRRKQQEINQYNAKYAQIEVITSIRSGQVIADFEEEAKQNRRLEKYYRETRHDDLLANIYRDKAIPFEDAVNRMRG